MKIVALLVAALLIAGCGSTKKPDPYQRANVALLDALPIYPGSTAPETTSSGTSTTRFAARDWRLPAGRAAETVIQWYEVKLPAAGWKLTGKSFDTLRATRHGAALSVGVRGGTLEVVANSRGF